MNPQDSRPRWTLFGDEIFKNEESFAAAKDYPYRSPDI